MYINRELGDLKGYRLFLVEESDEPYITSGSFLVYKGDTWKFYGETLQSAIDFIESDKDSEESGCCLEHFKNLGVTKEIFEDIKSFKKKQLSIREIMAIMYNKYNFDIQQDLLHQIIIYLSEIGRH